MSKYQDIGHWDNWYAEHRDAPGLEWSAKVGDTFLQRIKGVLGELPRPPKGKRLRLCELGCGSSTLAVALAREDLDVVGVDFSQEVINQMQQRHPELEWRCCDALQLLEEFEAGSFDCVVAKTLLDCFLTRQDAQAHIRRLLEQVRGVLKDHGRFVLLDKASAPHLSGDVVETFETGDRRLYLRTLLAVPHRSAADASVEGASEVKRKGGEVQRWEANLPPLPGRDLIMRKAAGGGVLVVQSAEGAAAAAGLQQGDRLLGFDRGDGKGLRFGEAGRIVRVIRERAASVTAPASASYSAESAAEEAAVEAPAEAPVNASDGAATGVLRVLVERPPAGKAARRSVSQGDYLLRVQRANVLRFQSQGRRYGNAKTMTNRRSLPQASLLGGGRISPALGMLDGLFS
mmetsp:Transcript_120914/g.269869  ORF Transcript_120914/g.269869 Transcript_120914/m.269869 type:complete len:402 (+) Transcript_120914:157-1362(+)